MESQNELTIIEQKARRRKITQNTVIYALLTIWGLCVLFPFYWMVLSSVKSYSEYSSEYVPKFLDGSFLGQELQRVQLGICSEVLHRGADHAELH